MFWIGLIVGIVIATIVIAGILLWSAAVTYGSYDTFKSMVDVTYTAAMNRESVVTVTHDDEVLGTAVFEVINLE